ncbi:MAG: glycosyltransferase [Bryobacteraceae bacterium]
MQIVLALPAYNEERALPQVLESFQRVVGGAGYSIRAVVVDDGSTDGTARVIDEWRERLPLATMKHERNRGLGETIRDALDLAARAAAPEDIIVTMDADNTHPMELILEMIPRIGDGYDVVIASRYRAGAGVVGLSGFRRLMSFGARVLYQVLFPIRGVRDYTCGFRAYRAGILTKAFERYRDQLVTERSFASMAEILLKLARLGARMSEAPMVLRYDLKGGASKMNVPRTVLKTLALMARLRFSRTASR